MSAQMPQCSVYIATSLDGFIAGEDDDLAWLETRTGPVPEGEDFGYHAFMNAVDTLVMGRNTYEKVLTFGGWPYGDKRVVVLSRGPVSIAPDLSDRVSASSEAPRALVERLGREGSTRLYIDGGVTIQRFLAAGLIDDLTMTLIPVVLGAGIPLFGPLPGPLPLAPESAQRYDCGLVQLRYRRHEAAGIPG